jgi:hypothetical protein
VIAVGVLLIAYGLLAPRAAASPQVVFDPQTGSYQLARPTLAADQIALPDRGGYAYQAAPPTYATPAGYTQTVYTQPVYTQPVQPRYVETPAPATRAASAPQRTVVRTVERPGRNWMIGGSTATGAGIGAMVGGKKGALIGAAIGGGASTLYEARTNK